MIEQTALATQEFAKSYAGEILLASFLPDVLNKLHQADKKLRSYFKGNKVIDSILTKSDLNQLKKLNVLEMDKASIEKAVQDDMLPVNAVTAALMKRKGIEEAQSLTILKADIRKEAEEKKSISMEDLNMNFNKSMSPIAISQGFLKVSKEEGQKSALESSHQQGLIQPG